MSIIYLESDLLNVFSNYINKFSPIIERRGKDIYLKDGIHRVLYYPNKRIFTATVQGTSKYTITIQLDKKQQKITAASCTCPYQYKCKHIAAVAYNLLLEEEALLGAEEQPSQKKKSKIKIAANQKAETHTITIDYSINLATQLTTLKPRYCKPFQTYSSDIRHFLVGNKTINSVYYETDWRNHEYKLIKDATFKFHEQTIEMKCSRCAYNKKEICCCTYNLLNALLPLVVHTGQENLAYDQYIQTIADKEKISTTATEKAFELELDYRNVNARLKSNDILDTTQIKILEEASSTSQNKMEEQFLSTLSQNKEIGEALVWSTKAAIVYDKILFLISGKLSSTKDKIASHIEKAESPLYLPNEEKNTYTELRSQLNYSIENIDDYTKDPDKISESLELLKSNIDFLKNSLNYYFDPSGYYNMYNYKLKKKDLNLFHFHEDTLAVRIDAFLEEGIYTIKPIFYLNGIVETVIDITQAKDLNWHFMLTQKMIAYLYEDSSTYSLYEFMDGHKEYKFLPKNKKAFFKILLKLEKSYVVNRDESLGISEAILTGLNKHIRLSEMGDHVVFHPELKKGKSIFNIYKPASKLNRNKLVIPDPKEVESFVEFFNGLHHKFEDGNDKLSFRHLHRNDFIKNEWHLSFFEACNKKNIIIDGYEAFEKIKFSSHKAKIEADISSAIDWFELNITMSFGKEKVTRKEWIKAIKNGQSYIQLKDGTLGIIPEEWLVKMTKMISLADETKNGLRINKLRFNVIDELFDKIKDKAVIDDIKKKRTLLENYNTDQRQEMPSGINAALRPYQDEGYQWLRFLESCQFGGILADDMGLGKTLQIISLLASAHQQDSCEALVVVPKSLIFNWAREIDKFYPELNYHIHHGLDRHQALEDKKNIHLIISTYGTVTRDIELLRKKKFTHIILDESQAIKNPASKRNKAIRLLKGETKLCMTGTPIQNNTFDLYAQISFTNPGLLGNQTYFRKYFANPIDKEGDHEASKLLLKMIHPFILRRTKEQVAKDLPDKTESVIYCDMLPHQRIMYTELKNQIRRDLLSLDDHDSQLKFKVLDGLLRLRQLCNSPLLVDKTLKGSDAKSVKIETLIYSLTEELGDGNALVFSQFVQMLTLIRKELDDLGIPYAYLDGSTRDREAAVSNYMNDDKCKIFLISLKAGNTGLNLTKAQYVYIVDPWWNPAVEAQAIDRTHRIGQKQKVFAYKMICKESIEEKIILLQKKKKKVAVQLIQTDESIFKALNKKDLLELFE